MFRIFRIAFAALLIAPVPAMAQTSDIPADPLAEDGFSEGFELLDRGARLLLRELADRIEPGLDTLRDGLEGLEGLGAYHAPEILPNGDIIIRRRAPLPPPEGEVEI